jgi:hypothetical protein
VCVRYGNASYHTDQSCNLCVPDFYCPGGEHILPCPEQHSSPSGATRCYCKAGFYSDSSIFAEDHVCKVCKPGSYCPGNKVTVEEQIVKVCIPA